VEGKIFSVEILEGVGPSVQEKIFLVEKLEGVAYLARPPP
jgi:hypothetical protein